MNATVPDPLPVPEPDPRLARILRSAAVPGLLDALAERLTPTDLQTLLLEVHRRRAAAVTPGRLLAEYGRNRFAAPSPRDPAALARLDSAVLPLLAADHGFDALTLSPVCPLGTHSALATVDQNKVLTTARTTEVVADVTNVLALECATRRRARLADAPRDRGRVRLAASHRVVRAQAFGGPGMTPHFALLGLCTAGRDEGGFRFETESLGEHVAALLAVLGAVGATGFRVTVTDLSGGGRRAALAAVLDGLAAAHPGTGFGFDDDRASGRGYYRDACFSVDADGVNLADGGFTDWTASLLSNAKERLLISGLGLDRLCG